MKLKPKGNQSQAANWALSYSLSIISCLGVSGWDKVQQCQRPCCGESCLEPLGAPEVPQAAPGQARPGQAERGSGRPEGQGKPGWEIAEFSQGKSAQVNAGQVPEVKATLE